MSESNEKPAVSEPLEEKIEEQIAEVGRKLEEAGDAKPNDAVNGEVTESSAAGEGVKEGESKGEKEKVEEQQKQSQKFQTVTSIIARVRNDPNLSEKDKLDTLSLLVQKFVEENQNLREDITVMSENLDKHAEARNAMKTLNEAYKKQIKLVKEESELRLEEEQAKRQDTMGGYSSSMSELAALLETQQNQNGRMAGENVDMMAQMKLLIGETEKREKAIQRMQQEFELQLKLLEHQVAKAQIEKAEVKADMTKERLEITQELTLERERSKNLEETVKLLKEQADVYQKQMEELQMGAGKNTKSFQHFKTQIDKLTNQMVHLERDTASWREKYEVSSQQVKRMNTATMDKDKECLALKKKLESMVKLNKTLTEERSSLIQKVKDLES